jgi:hypothetical protein
MEIDSKTYAKARRIALAEYLRELAAVEAGAPLAGASETYPLSPARATKVASAKTGLPPKGAVVGIVAAVYYRENGLRSPLAFDRLAKNGRPTEAGIGRAVRKARDLRGRLARWEVLAVRLAVALDLDPEAVSVAAVEGYYALAGGDKLASYSGRGTRAGAPKTRASATAEVSALAAVAPEERTTSSARPLLAGARYPLPPNSLPLARDRAERNEKDARGRERDSELDPGRYPGVFRSGTPAGRWWWTRRKSDLALSIKLPGSTTNRPGTKKENTTNCG